MTVFAVIAVAMVAIALAWVVVPLLRGARSTGIVREASNVAILRDQLRELENDLANDTLSREQYDQSRRELEQRVLDESRPVEGGTATVARGGRKTVWAVAIAMPVLAAGLYAMWGNHEAFTPVAKTEPGQHELSPERVNAMVERLAQRLEKEPNDPEGWLVLARTYYALKRYPEAAKAFEKTVAMIPGEAAIWADYADAVGAAQNSLEGKPTDLIAQALKVDPKNWKALALAGTAAFDRKDYKQAVVYWEDMKKVVPPGAQIAQSIDSSIAEARALGGLAPAAAASETAPMPSARAGAKAPAAPPTTAAAPAATAAPSAAAASKIEGSVALSPDLKGKVSPNDTVFIFARPESSRMPLAIMRRQVKELPATFTLDDSMAMSPNMTISSVPTVIVGARVSKSGTAMPQSGDLEGFSPPVKAGTSGLFIVIDRTVP